MTVLGRFVSCHRICPLFPSILQTYINKNPCEHHGTICLSFRTPHLQPFLSFVEDWGAWNSFQIGYVQWAAQHKQIQVPDVLWFHLPCTTGLIWNTQDSEHFRKTLADQAGALGSAPRLSDLEAPVYNLRAKQWILGPLFFIFSKKVRRTSLSINITFLSHSSSILGMNIIFLSHSSSLTVLIISYFIFLSAYFYIIRTQPITLLVCKDWNKVFFHTLLHKKWELIHINIINIYKTLLHINLYVKLFWNFNKKCSG